MPNIGDRFNPSELFEGVYIVNPVLKFRGLSPGSKLVWGRLYRFSGKKGKIFPAINTVADDLGLGTKQTRRYLHELVEMEFLGVETDPGHSNDYFFRWHAAFEGERGTFRARRPLPDTGVLPLTAGVPHIPLPLKGVPTPPLYGSTPLPLKGVIREEVREEYLIEEITYSPSFGSTPEKPSVPEDSQEPETVKPEGGGFADQSALQLDEPVLTFVANAYRQSRGAKLAKAALKKESYRIEQQEKSWGAEYFRAALWNYLGTSSDWLRENQWPLALFLKSVSPWVPDVQAASSASPGVVTIIAAPAFRAVAPAPDYVAQWNDAVPGRPAGSLLSRTQKKLNLAVSDSDFADNFDTICQKAAKLIAAGEPTTFEWLFAGKDEKNPNWAGLLEGKFDFLMKRSKSQGGIDWEAIEREAAEEEEGKEKQ